jgi:hypothetical protein
MSLLNRKSDVKNHLSARHHKANDLLNQLDKQVIAPVETGAIKEDPLDLAEDPIGERSSSSASHASKDRLATSSTPQTPVPPRSVRE